MAYKDPLKQKESARRHYEANKAKVKARAKEWTYNNRRKLNEWLYQYLLRHPCVDCGEADPVVLEFDHKGGKEFNVGNARQKGVSLTTLKVEVGKCEVRCANCHRRKTYQQFGRTHRGE